MTQLARFGRSVQRVALEVISRTGYGQPFLNRYHELVGVPFLAPLDDVDEEIRRFHLPETESRGTVLIPLMPGSTANNHRACVLGHAFRTRGYKPLALVSDTDLDLCLSKNIHADESYISDVCTVKQRRTTEAFGIEAISIDEAVSDSYSIPSIPDDDLRTVEYRGVPVGKYAAATARKFFKKYYLDLDEEYDRTVVEKLVRSGQKLVDACERLFTERNIVAAIVLEDQYIQGGIPLSIAARHGANAYSQEMGFRDGTLLFGRYENRNSLPWFTDFDVLNAAVSEPLTDAQKETLDQLMAQRWSGTGGLCVYSARTENSIDMSGGRTTLGMFTNLTWDASLEVSDTAVAFPDVFEWINTTLDHLGGRSDVSLVLKTHPAESALGTTQSVEAHVKGRYDQLPPNVRLLSPETDINTYELIDDVDVGLVYNSTVGLEMAYAGLPVIVGGDTHYRGLGFTYDPATPAEYTDLLADLDSVTVTESMHDRARRYAYTFLVRTHIDFPFYTSSSDYLDFEILPVSHNDVVNHEDFDLLVEKIIEGEPVIKEKDARDGLCANLTTEVKP